MDKFVNALIQPTSMIGNLAGPIIKFKLDSILLEYQKISQTFLSNNIYLADNDTIQQYDGDNRLVKAASPTLKSNTSQPIAHDKRAKINNESAIKKLSKEAQKDLLDNTNKLIKESEEKKSGQVPEEYIAHEYYELIELDKENENKTT